MSNTLVSSCHNERTNERANETNDDGEREIRGCRWFHRSPFFRFQNPLYSLAGQGEIAEPSLFYQALLGPF